MPYFNSVYIIVLMVCLYIDTVPYCIYNSIDGLSIYIDTVYALLQFCIYNSIYGLSIYRYCIYLTSILCIDGLSIYRYCTLLQFCIYI